MPAQKVHVAAKLSWQPLAHACMCCLLCLVCVHRTPVCAPPVSCGPRACLSTRASLSSTTHATGRQRPGLTSIPCCHSSTGTVQPQLHPATGTAAAAAAAVLLSHKILMLLWMQMLPVQQQRPAGQQLTGCQASSRCVARDNSGQGWADLITQQTADG
jgi:hypothetical protein